MVHFNSSARLWLRRWLHASPVVRTARPISDRLTVVPPPQQCGLCGMLFLSLLTLLYASCRTGSAAYLQNWIDAGDGLEVGRGRFSQMSTAL